MKKIFYSLAIALVALMVSIPAKAAAGRYFVNDYEDFKLVFRYGLRPNNAPLQSGDTIQLIVDINQTYNSSRDVFDVRSGQVLTLNLNGHTVRYEATASALLHLFDISEGATLNIIDSKGGGQFILNDKDGNGQTHLFKLSKNATLNIYGGSLLCLYNNVAWSRCAAVNVREGVEGAVVNVYGGLISSIKGSNGDLKPAQINIYGGIIGTESFLSESYDAALWHDPFNGTIKGGKIYGLFGTAALADNPYGGKKALAENTKVYIDGVLTPNNQLVSDREAYEHKLVEVIYEPSFSVNNIAVTSANAADILGDGKVSFDIASNTLYLKTKEAGKPNTINGNIVYDDFKLNIVVDGIWSLNGRIVGHDGDLIISPAHFALTEEDGDILAIHSQNSTAVSLNGKSFCAKNRVRVFIEDNNTHTQTAVSCGMFVINNAWFDAWGKKPIVDCQNSMITNAKITSGSLKDNNVIQVKPNITQYVVWTDVYDKSAGTVTGDGLVNEGVSHTVTATPKSGYHFLRWSNGVTENPYTFVVTQDTVLYALFEADVVINYYDINVVSSDETMGTVSGGGTHIEQGQTVTITATPNEGYQFLYWTTADGQVQGAISQWTVTKDETLIAHFRVAPPADAYNLWVCGTQVTGSNSADILGDGVWCYDHETRTLSTMKMATYNIENHGFIEDWVTDAGSLTVVFNHLIDATCTTTDNVIRTAIVSTKGMTFTGSAYNGPSVTAKNMYVANFSDVFTITGHITTWLYLQNTSDFGRNNFNKAILLAGKTPSLVVNGANLEVLSGVGESTGYKVSNKTDQAANLSLINAVVDDGSISAKSLYISDNSPKYEINYLTPSIESLCLTSAFGLSFFEGTHFNLYA